MKQSPSVESRVHAIANRLRAASLSSPAKPAEAVRLEAAISLMGQTASGFKQALKSARNMAETTEMVAGLQWANATAAQDQARLATLPRMAPAAVKQILDPIRREAADELTNLLRLVDVVLDAMAESSMTASGRTDPEAAAVRHFVKHCRAVVGGIGR